MAPTPTANALDFNTLAQTLGVVVQSLVALLTVYLAWRTAATSLADRAEGRREGQRQAWITLAGVMKMALRVREEISETDRFTRQNALIPLEERLKVINPSSIDSTVGATGFLELQTLLDRLLAEDPIRVDRALADVTASIQHLQAGMNEMDDRTHKRRKE